MGFKTRLALVVSGQVLVLAAGLYISRLAAPLVTIDSEITRLKDEWQTSTVAQSLTDKYMSNKITRSEWLAKAHSYQAKRAWLLLSTNPKTNHPELAKKIKAAWPHAEKWV